MIDDENRFIWLADNLDRLQELFDKGCDGEPSKDEIRELIICQRFNVNRMFSWLSETFPTIDKNSPSFEVWKADMKRFHHFQTQIAAFMRWLEFPCLPRRLSE